MYGEMDDTKGTPGRKKLSGYEKMHAYLAVLGCRPVYMNQLMDIVYATREEAELLQKKALAPLIQLRGYAYDLSGAFFITMSV